MRTYALEEAMIEASERLGDSNGCSIIQHDQMDWTVDSRLQLEKLYGETGQRYVMRQGIYNIYDIIHPAIYLIPVDEDGGEDDHSKCWIVSRSSMRSIWATDDTVEMYASGEKLDL